MASTLSMTYTGKYSSSSRSITAWVRYTWNPNYSATQSQLIVHSMGVRNNSSSAMEWGTSSTNGPKYLAVTATDYSQYKVDRTSTDFKWASGNYDYWNFITNGRSSAITAWDGNAPAVYYYNKGASARTIYLVGHVYKKGAWAVNSDFSVALSVPALTYSVSYNANGGSGAPGAQTKTHGATLTLSGTVPTRQGYDFLGWSTSSSASVPSYRYGLDHSVATSFTTNANTVLYAVWHESFVPPRIDNLRAYRVAADASGYNPSALTSGTKGYADYVYTEPSNYSTVNRAILFGETSYNTSSDPNDVSHKYAYSTSVIPVNSAVDVTAIITGTKYTYEVGGVTYGGEAFSITAGTFISKEAYIWDAFKTIDQNDNEYQSFAVGQLARESEDQYDSEEPVPVEGDMDVFFRSTFIGDMYIYIDQNAASGVDYEIMQALEALGWAEDVIENYSGGGSSS